MAPDRVFRTQTVDGLVTPAFIHNGSYFLVDMPVYADGLVDCWEMVDLALFREKLDSGWVTPSAPEGARVSVHGLADWEIASTRWDLGASAFYERVESMIRELNPRLQNLHDCHGTTVRVVGKVRVSILGSPKKHQVRVIGPDEPLPKRVSGDAMHVLVKDGDHHLARARIFEDGVVEISGRGTAMTMDLDAFDRATEDGTLAGSVPSGTRVHVEGLGSFIVAKEISFVDPRNKARELRDLYEILQGRPGAVERCARAYEAYVDDPTDARREELRRAYQAVPHHHRMFVGDMDTKDVAVRMILFGEQEIERWSHRAAARAIGERDLPTIRMPKPK